MGTCLPMPLETWEHTPVAQRMITAQAVAIAQLQAEAEGVPTAKKIADLIRFLPWIPFADAPVCAIEPPAGFEALSTAMTEQCTITIVYDHGWQCPTPRMITPRLLLEVHGVAYVIAHCHLSEAERTFRLDRIRGCWLA
jgi:hypothetical protein